MKALSRINPKHYWGNPSKALRKCAAAMNTKMAEYDNYQQICDQLSQDTEFSTNYNNLVNEEKEFLQTATKSWIK